MARRPLATTVVPCLALVAALVASLTTVSARSSSPVSELHRRASEWQQALVARNPQAIIALIDVADRGAPRLRLFLSEAVAMFSQAAATRVLEVSVEKDGRRGHSTHLLAFARFSTIGTLPPRVFAWSRGLDGRWYVDPFAGED